MRDLIDVRRLVAALPSDDGWAAPVVLDEVTSTNAEAQRAAELWQPVLAELQLAGRGRLGRGWSEVPRAGLAMSVLVPRPPDPGWLPLLAGLAVHEALRENGVGATLKWPNDVLLPADEDRKVCGILCELDTRRDLVVVGIGINVDHERAELPVATATSLRLAGADLDRTDLAAAVLVRLRRAHEAMMKGGAVAAVVRTDYRGACSTIGRAVDVHLPDGTVERHHVTAVDDDGSLRLRGRSDSVRAGDVHHIRPVTSPPRERV